MGPFNNREIATAFWLVAFAVWALRRDAVRKSLGRLFRTFWRVKIFVPICLMILYVIGAVVFLEKVGIWKVGLLKDTIIWFFAGAMAMMMRYATADDRENIFRKILKESIKIVILLEFLINTYTFSLPVELILIPLITFIAMLDVVANMKEEYATVAKLTKGIQVVFGFVILWIAFNRAIADFQNLKSLDTFRSIALAPFLSVMMFPFIYIMLLLSKYENLFVQLKIGREKPRSLKRYARRRIIMHAGLSLTKVQYLLKNHALDLLRIERESDVDSFLKEAGNPDAGES